MSPAMLEDADCRSVLDAVNAGLIVVDGDCRVVLWNDWIAGASGIPRAHAAGRALREIFAGARIGVLESVAANAIATGASALLTHALHPALLPLKSRAGAAITHDVVAVPAGGGGRHCLIHIVDVSISAKRERFLRERQNARYDALVAGSSDAILTMNQAGVIQNVNPMGTAQFGYSQEELVGQKASKLFRSAEAWTDLWNRLLAEQGAVHPVELAVNCRDGSLKYFEISPSRWRDGARLFVTVMMRNINDRRAADEALRRSEEQSRANARTLTELNDVLRRSGEALNESARRKDEFLAILAHELRNPLAPLQNGLSLMRLIDGNPAAQEQNRGMMERQLGHLVRLIDDLMDVSRINRDMIQLNKVPTSIEAIVRQAVETCRPAIDARQHRLAVELPEVPVPMEGDVVRLVQVFANLLNNAAKYTPNRGQITLAARLEGGGVEVRVRDSGIGIPQDMLGKVFDIFMQVDHSAERSHGGLGIGLSLVRRLVDMHGGTVTARSPGPGKGSEFVVWLPRADAPARVGDAEPRETEPIVRRRILIADDNQDAADSLAALLGVMGHDTRSVHDGLSALKLAESFRPEVILLDIGMPRMSGLETARRLREQDWAQEVLLVALTGLGQEEDRNRSEKAGFDAHLVKPVDYAVLQTLLNT